MIKQKHFSGYCPTLKTDTTIPIDYVFNFDCWEKGTGECPHSSICHKECPILKNAPDELKNL